jgi:hypothetical protein
MRRLLLLSLSLACAHASPPAPASSATVIGGVVSDAKTGAPLVDAYVKLTARQSKELSRAALTDLQGNFSFYGLPAAAYEIAGAKFGYATSQVIRVTPDQSARLEVRLAPAEAKAGEAANGPVIVPPALLSGPHPEFTPQAVSENVQGSVLLDCLITLDGDARDCHVVERLRIMDEVTLAVMEKRKYRPARIDGEPFATRYRFRFKFVLA